MSDGPHSSLEMSPKWKRAAECADIAAYNAGEVVEAIATALLSDFRRELDPRLIGCLRQVFESKQYVMFDELNESRLREGEEFAAGHSLGMLVLEFAESELRNGRPGETSVQRVLELAIEERFSRGKRQVEEHYLRRSTKERAIKVSNRLHTNAAGRLISSVAEDLLAGQNSATRSSRRDSVDEGPDL